VKRIVKGEDDVVERMYGSVLSMEREVAGDGAAIEDDI
jgi:hypothetical protein